MSTKYYPWPGEFTVCDNQSCVAAVLLNTDYIPPENVAIYGSLKTENIGIEKIIANVISNPHIRYLVVCGEEIRGHNSGQSLIAVHKNGVDNDNKIIEANGVIPYIENLDIEAVERFQKQIEMVNLIGVDDKDKIDETINKFVEKKPEVFGEPYIAVKISSEKHMHSEDKRALHSKIKIDYTGKIKRRNG
ncbi:MAG: tetrahydromethanopterin S-methyltransferase subunit A [Candidatus Thermoplasmatota archaeon]